MRLQDLLIALVVSGLAVTLLLAAFADIRTAYDLKLSSAENTTLANIETTTQNLTTDVGTLEHNITANLEGAKVDITDQFSAFVSAAFSSVRLVLTSTLNGPQLAFNMVTGLTRNIGIPIPAVVLAAVLSLLMIPVAFVIISAIFKHPL